MTVASVRPKLYPPGLVLLSTAIGMGEARSSMPGHRSSPGIDGPVPYCSQDSWVVGADLGSFGELRLSGTMGSSHLPQSYARALLGDCPVAAEQ